MSGWCGSLKEIDADIYGLQEVDSGVFIKEGLCQSSLLGKLTGLHVVEGFTINDERGRYGNITLSRFPIKQFTLVNLTYRKKEPRGAIVSQISIDSSISLRFVNLHLGLSLRERMRQCQLLRASLNREDHGTIVVGDFNEWAPWRKINWHANYDQYRDYPVRSFPTRLPIFTLDRIFATSPVEVKKTWAHVSPDSRLASDHLPVVAQLSHV